MWEPLFQLLVCGLHLQECNAQFSIMTWNCFTQLVEAPFFVNIVLRVFDGGRGVPSYRCNAWEVLSISRPHSHKPQLESSNCHCCDIVHKSASLIIESVLDWSQTEQWLIQEVLYRLDFPRIHPTFLNLFPVVKSFTIQPFGYLFISGICHMVISYRPKEGSSGHLVSKVPVIMPRWTYHYYPCRVDLGPVTVIA